jgi:hypothetical protein
MNPKERGGNMKTTDTTERTKGGIRPTVRVDSIMVGERFRKDLGSIVDSLVDSIREVGLLHPIVVDAAGNLIAGECRLMACVRLGWHDIPATVVDLGADALRIQEDENTVRKNFTTTEAVAIRNACLAREKTKAKERMSEGGKVGKVSTPSGKSRDWAAKGTGYSGKTLDKAEAVMKAAAADPALEPIVEEMDRTGKVDPAYRKVREAVPDLAIGNLDPNLVYGRPSRARRAPEVMFARVLSDLDTTVRVITDENFFDFSGVTATPGQIEMLTKVIRMLTRLRRTVSKNAPDAGGENVDDGSDSGGHHDED